MLRFPTRGESARAPTPAVPSWRLVPSRVALPCLVALCVMLAGTPPAVTAQTAAAAAPSLTLDSAIARALRTHPRVQAARAQLAAAEGRRRQAGALPNPSLSWQYERTSASGAENSQHITTLEFPLAVGVRGARRDAATATVQEADAELRAAELDLMVEVSTRFAAAVASERRSALARDAAEEFIRAEGIAGERLAAGDISGYQNRRIRLEAARYRALAAAEAMARRQAQRALLVLVDPTADDEGEVLLLAPSRAMATAPDAIAAIEADLLAQRPDVLAARAAVQRSEALQRQLSWERVPQPTVIGGIKSENAAGLGALRGIAAGVTLPLPLFDRRSGDYLATSAASDQARALERETVRRARADIGAARDALRETVEQHAALAPALGDEAARAVASARAAYAEGEISLLEWLDAVRAYVEAERDFASLASELIIRRATLARALGQPLPR